ncbi:MAG: DUF131 domain-containing protein [Candidatus Korarchaeota archaeon]|nr:DUF131 domain-containing protein [Candidatus Korarchaeota archaeon]
MNPVQTLGLFIMVVGLLLIMISLLVPGRGRAERGGERGRSEEVVGGIILIGPIPIVFGKNLTKGMLLMLVLSGLAMAVTLLALYLMTGG